MHQPAMRTRLCLLTSAATLHLASPPALAGASVDITTEAAAITLSIPNDTQPGESGPVGVFVRPNEGAQPPTAIRLRVGMPAHGHWIAEEGAQPFAPGRLEFSAAKCAAPPQSSSGIMCLPKWFDTLFPMDGRYRIRVWLDYPNGHTVTSAVDFDLADDKSIDLIETAEPQAPGAAGGVKGEHSGTDHKH